MDARPVLRTARYSLFAAIARGGMASVHFGRIVGPAGFSKIVAIKRLHSHLAEDAAFRTMLLDEARLASRIQHRNVVPTLDVVAEEGELFLVLDYVRGASLAEVVRTAAEQGLRVPVSIALAVVIDALRGLQAAHDATGPDGARLHIVHRDVSPQNILVGADGSARIADFGVAKAAVRVHSTRDGELKGKLSYMAPEQFRNEAVDRRTDIYSAGVVLWELLAGQRLFSGDPAAIVTAVLVGEVPLLGSTRTDVAPALERVVAKALERAPEERYPTAEGLARALGETAAVATLEEVSAWIQELLSQRLEQLDAFVREIEAFEDGSPQLAEAPPSSPPLFGPNDVARMRDLPTSKFVWDAEPETGAAAPADAVATVIAVMSDVHPTISGAQVTRGVEGVRERPRAARWLVGSLAALLLTATLVFSVRLQYRSEPRAASIGEPAGSPTPAIDRSEASPASPIAAPPPDSASAPAPGPSSVTGDHAGPSAASARTAETRAPTPRANGRPRTTSAKSACDPPYVVDERGVKEFKRQCM